MTTLHSLEIQGIRCFSPNSTQTIRFEKPLTLIVGQNGAGKTTIVECLKMGASGILPPNSDRGKSFIHDCKLSEEREVRAHITLNVETYAQELVSATRKYTMTRDKNIPNKAAFKAGETVLRVKRPDGQESSVSMKTSDLDASMPSLMGLSRALIDSVIFCHQDENNWALDDLAKVKARFDDLLETSRYTKAIAALNKARKEQEDAAHINASKLEIVKTKLIQMAELRNQIKANMEDVSKVQNTIATLESELHGLQETVTVLRAEQETVSSVFVAIRNATDNVGRLSEEVTTMHQSMNEIYEEGLEDMHQYHATLSNEVEATKATYDNITLKIDQLMELMNELHQKINMSKNKVRWKRSRRLMEIQMSEYRLARENIKTTTEAMESIVKEIKKEMDADDATEFSESGVAAFVEQLENVSLKDNPTYIAFRECKGGIVHLEEKVLQLTTKESKQNLVLEALTAEMSGITKQIGALDELQSAQKQQEDVKQQAMQQVTEHQQRLQNLNEERERLSLLAIKLKNSIHDASVEDEQELRAAVKFLEAVVNNDRQLIVTYVKDVIGTGMDESKYITGLRDFFAKFLDPAVPVSDGLPSSAWANTEQFQQDCVTAILQMISHTKDLELGDAGDPQASTPAIEPYNALLKIVTNMRISDYVAYYKALLAQGSAAEPESQGSYADVRNNLSSVDAEIAKVQSSIEGCNAQITKIEAEAMQAAVRFEQIDGLKTKLAEIHSNQQQCDEDIASTRRALETARSQLKGKRKECDELDEQITAIKKANAVKAAKLSTLLKRYQKSNEMLKKYKEELGSSERESNGDEDLQVELNCVTESVNNNRMEQKDVLQSLNNHRQLLENLQQNIKLKTKQQELEKAQEHLDGLHNQVGERSEEALTARIKEMDENCSRISLEIATLQGTVITRQDNIAKLQQMLESDNYANVQKRFSDTLLALKTHTMAKEVRCERLAINSMQDLEIYTKTLEMQLHKFHSEKIAQINGVLKRVWREVYTGNNVDYIEIQSNVDTTVPSTGLAPRSYNYRMVMVTHNGVEMDMRGHCSAGERVLASLILRITLTETFCSNCNILALDEPTTNLDKDNIVVGYVPQVVQMVPQSLESSLAKLSSHEDNVNCLGGMYQKRCPGHAELTWN
ncbi:DNA repair protein RAD50 [Babesia caballi]|uniref:DNA repair protein RAD50 n=1 Tax=Babesia caballi TaxID=5871 RepID=A0AAV4LUY0_BABCB|nr:DNA repair protein RAD50 [Babesia caballi]